MKNLEVLIELEQYGHYRKAYEAMYQKAAKQLKEEEQ